MQKFERSISLIPLRLIEWPKTCCLVIMLLTSFLVYQMGSVQFDSSLEGFLEKKNSYRQDYFNFKDTYGQSEYFILLIKSDSVFTPRFHKHLNAISDDILNHMPFVAGVETIANSRQIKSEDDVIIVGSLFDGLSNNAQSVRTEAITNPYYVNRLINEAGDTTAIVIRLKAFVESAVPGEMKPLHLKETQKALKTLRVIVNNHQNQFSNKILIGGSPMAVVELTHETRKDIMVFSLSAILLVCFALMFFFRRFSAVFLPLISLLLAIAITMSLMIIGQYPIQVTSSILPSFLMAVCIGDSVHFLKAFYKEFDKGRKKKNAIRYAIKTTSVAMFFTTLMTSVGLLSFAHSQIVPIASFGLFSALGVWVALLLTLIILPSLMLLVPMARCKVIKSNINLTVSINKYVNFIREYALTILVLSAILMAVCIILSTQLSLSHDPLKWLKADNETRLAVETIDRDLTGTMQVELLLKANGEPISIEQLQKLDDWLKTLSNQSDTTVPIRSVNSIIDLIKQMNQVFQPEKGLTLPSDASLLAQQILLLQLNASDDISRLCNTDCSEIRVTLTTPWKDAVYYSDFLDGIEQSFNHVFVDDLSLKVTGMASIINRTFTEMLSSMLMSYIIAVTLVSILMVMFMKNLRLGLAMMLPNLLPIFAVLSIMFIFDMPLDLFSLLMGSIAIGLIVDDSVHFISAFQRYQGQQYSIQKALVNTLSNTGSALFITTLVLCIGFISYTLSDLQNLAFFGIATSLCIAFALIADFLIAPAIIVLLYERQYLK